MEKTRLVVNCLTGETETISLAAEEQAAYEVRQSESAAADEREARMEQAFQRDLSDYRSLWQSGKLRRNDTTVLTMPEQKLVGRLVGWLLLRDSMD